MTRPRTFDARTLDLAHARLAKCARAGVDTLEVLESVSCKLAGLDPSSAGYQAAERRPNLSEMLNQHVQPLVNLIQQSKIPAPLALATLADRAKDGMHRRTQGAYYTDSRLAVRLASRLPLSDHGAVVDPACGSGMLLAAAALRVSHQQPTTLDNFLTNRLVGFDLDPVAIRGATLAIGSLAHRESTVKRLRNNLIQADSLLLGPGGLQSVVGGTKVHFIANPPWEQARVTVQELAKRIRAAHHYGLRVDPELHTTAKTAAAATREYANRLRDRYPLLGNGTIDLSNAFLELMHEASDDQTVISALLPAGLLRNKGPRALRNVTLLGSRAAQVDLYDNKPGFFDIDSRFKFAHVTISPPQAAVAGLRLTHPVTPNGAIHDAGHKLSFGRRRFHLFGKEGLIPEVRTRHELKILETMFRNGSLPEFLDSPGTIVREVDMTNDRSLFVNRDAHYDFPVIEGRMVHQYDAGAKRHEAGEGRRAKWISNGVYANDTSQPQFGLLEGSLPERVAERARTNRIGFCDVTGQTNERTMLAAVIPENTVCGNKVPTILPKILPIDSTLLVHIWNSFAFDWMMRRYVTTSVNFFILRSMPLPHGLISGKDDPIADARRRLDLCLAKVGQNGRKTTKNIVDVGHARASLEASIFSLYGLMPSAVEEVLADFPSLDRHQPPLEGEKHSQVTRDFVLAQVWQGHDQDRAEMYQSRCADAVEAGAAPFVPTDAARFAAEV